MYASVRALLSRIIDYAGSFPPANLSLYDAIRNFGLYMKEPEAWMLGRMVCPADRLKDTVPLVQEAMLPDGTMPFTILGRGGKDAPSFFKNIEADITDMKTFAGACAGLVSLESYEAKLPASLFSPIKANHINAAIATLAFLFEKAGMALQPFVEVPVSESAQYQATLTALHEDQQSAEAGRRQVVKPCGLKLRTGGMEALAFPSSEMVAAVLVGCRKTHVPFKATAGLHHPIRQHRAEVQTKMHGFVNVFVAGCLSYAHDLAIAEIQACVDDEDVKSFVLDEGGITWRHHRLTNEQITAAREWFTSFGSCSLDEPREDLRSIGWC